MWWAPLNQTSGLQGHSGGGWGDLAGNDLGTGSGWKQSRQNQTPLRSDETRSPSTTANLHAALAAPLHLSFVLLTLGPCGRLCSRVKGPVGLMDKASASGAGDSRFESWAGHCFREAFRVSPAVRCRKKSLLWDSNPRPPAY